MHQCSAVVLHCIDFRFIHRIVHFMKEQGLLDRYDDIALAGAAKNLADPYDASDPDLVYRQIAVSRKLHGVTDVYIINHTDCGAYGGQQAFTSAEEERGRHEKDLLRAKEMIEHHFAEEGLTVTPILAVLKDGGVVEFVKV